MKNNKHVLEIEEDYEAMELWPNEAGVGVGRGGCMTGMLKHWVEMPCEVVRFDEKFAKFAKTGVAFRHVGVADPPPLKSNEAAFHSVAKITESIIMRDI